jgi:hypothetical protein
MPIPTLLPSQTSENAASFGCPPSLLRRLFKAARKGPMLFIYHTATDGDFPDAKLCLRTLKLEKSIPEELEKLFCDGLLTSHVPHCGTR